MLNFEEYNILGDCMNDTWGKSSTAKSGSNFSTCKVSWLGKDHEVNQILLSYNCIISFGHIHERERELYLMSQEGDSVLDACLKRIKDEFKEATGRTLKTNTVMVDSDWDLLSLGQHSGRREALYKKKAIVEVE